jgi:hypothetical protein
LQVTTKKNPELPNVPLAIDFAKTEEARRLLKYAVHDVAIMQRLFFLPPGTPKDRVALLRKSFLDTLKDPEYIAESNKTSLTIGPVSGEEIEGIVSGLFKLDSAMIAKLKSVLVPQGQHSLGLTTLATRLLSKSISANATLCTDHNDELLKSENRYQRMTLQLFGDSGRRICLSAPA